MKLLTPGRLERAMGFLWALVLVTLPVTSFRYLPFVGANTQVRPLSLIPAVFLLVLLGIRCIQEQRLLFWSNSFLPLLVFILVTLFSSAAGLFLAPPDYLQNTYVSRVLRAWITLAIGLVFFFTTIGMNRHELDLKFTLKWLYIGFTIQAGWSLLQLAGFSLQNQGYGEGFIDLLSSIQTNLMVSGLAPHQRISGLTLEPSWLAAELIALYFPWAFASLFKGYRWTRRPWVTPFILIVSIFLLFLTFSRSGILIAVVAVGLSLIFAGWNWVRHSWDWFLRPFRLVALTWTRKTFEVGLRIVLIVCILFAAAGGIFLLSQNKYFAQIWVSQKTDVVAYLVDIYAGPRLAYAQAGWTIFEQHPWTGVGLGAVGLYIRDALPDWSHFNIPEISVILSPDYAVYSNAKNLYIRLLAETGILGFWSFIAFYLFMLGRILEILRSHHKELVFVGAAGLFSWIAIIGLGLSQDSFAMPTIWIPLGIMIGMADSQN